MLLFVWFRWQTRVSATDELDVWRQTRLQTFLHHSWRRQRRNPSSGRWSLRVLWPSSSLQLCRASRIPAASVPSPCKRRWWRDPSGRQLGGWVSSRTGWLQWWAGVLQWSFCCGSVGRRWLGPNCCETGVCRVQTKRCLVFRALSFVTRLLELVLIDMQLFRVNSEKQMDTWLHNTLPVVRVNIMWVLPHWDSANVRCQIRLSTSLPAHKRCDVQTEQPISLQKKHRRTIVMMSL